MFEARRLSFGDKADLYDRRRPSYPAQLVDDVLGLASGNEHLKAIEVGAGTGKATLLFAARGVRIDAVEPSAGMAATLRANTAALPNVTIVESEFESLQAPDEPYELLYSGQAWHWIDPERRYALARAVLAPGGWLAAFWNRPVWEHTSLRAELDDVYTRVAPAIAADGPMQPRCALSADVWGRWAEEIANADGFGDAEVKGYEWQMTYTAVEYTELLRTHSDHALLDPDTRAALLSGIAGVIDAAGGELRAQYLTRLCLARAV
jgi:SAM-dependent methyltransferase